MSAEPRCTLFTLGIVMFSGCVVEEGSMLKNKTNFDFDLCSNLFALSSSLFIFSSTRASFPLFSGIFLYFNIHRVLKVLHTVYSEMWSLHLTLL